MTPEQVEALSATLTRLGHPEFETIPGEEDILMLSIDGQRIGGALYILGLPDEKIMELIEIAV